MKLGLIGAALAIVAAGAVPYADAHTTITTSCKPRLVGTSVVYCGPAQATLSTLRGEFTKGSCKRSVVNGVQQFTVKLGVRTQNATTNNGKRYFGLTISGPLTHPTGGGVIAYANGKRWGGVGIGFHGNAQKGSFVASGIRGNTGSARGTYDCG